MQYDFTSLIDRRGKDALAVEHIPTPGAELGKGFSKIPMWVADMGFATAPSVTQAILNRAAHPIFGYFNPSDEYYDAILRWQTARNGMAELTKGCIGHENGVLSGMLSALGAVCSRGDRVLLHAPAYVGFTKALENSGYRLALSSLRQDGTGVWRMDLADMEDKLKTYQIRAAILCSPHNPTGRVWARKELEAAMALFEKYDVTVISDEIWSDLALAGHRHIPTQSVSEDARYRTVALYAPSKTFNLSGLNAAYHIIYNRKLRARVEKESSLSHQNNMNVLSMHALMGAYSDEGARWLEELRAVLAGNVDFACDYIARHFPGVEVAKPEGTYMLFLDCTRWCSENGKTLDELLRAGTAVGVVWQDGRPFYGPCHIRMNLALPHALVEEAFERLRKYVF